MQISWNGEKTPCRKLKNNSFLLPICRLPLLRRNQAKDRGRRDHHQPLEVRSKSLGLVTGRGQN